MITIDINSLGRDNCKHCQNTRCEHYGKDREFVYRKDRGSCKVNVVDLVLAGKIAFTEAVEQTLRNFYDNATDYKTMVTTIYNLAREAKKIL